MSLELPQAFCLGGFMRNSTPNTGLPEMTVNHQLPAFYEALLAYYGPQQWWPGETPFEVAVGAVLTQNTNWGNVERAIVRLKERNLLSPEGLRKAGFLELAEAIRPAGYYNVKAKRLKNLINWLWDEHGGSLENLAGIGDDLLREELLGINGIGRESADSIMLYALGRPVCVVDAYTFRVLTRHGLIDDDADYELMREYCEGALAGVCGEGSKALVYNEFHALVVAVGKGHCRPRPRCDGCPLECFEHEVPETE